MADYELSCFFCRKAARLAMIAHRKEGWLVGWVFACPKHLSEAEQVSLVPAHEVEQVMDYLINFADLDLKGSLKNQIHTVVMHYATQMGRWEKRYQERKEASD